MLLRRPFLLLCIACFVGLPVVAEEVPEEGEVSEESSDYRDIIVRFDPMDLTGLEPELANVLRKYYSETFTDSFHWDRVESLRFDGVLHLEQGAFRFVAFKKKPNYVKMVLHLGSGGRLVLAFDGEDAWQLNTLQDKEPKAMAVDEAANFIRDAATGGNLLYPLIPNKEIQVMGAVEVDGNRCFDLKITLPDGQEVYSALDMTTYLEVRQITTNQVTAAAEVLTHEDLRSIDGVRIPFVSTLTVAGEQVHQSRLFQVKTNLGVMPWMFQRPSGAYVPGDVPGEVRTRESAPQVDSVDVELESLNPFAAPSAFEIDLSDSERRSLLQDIGQLQF